MQALRRFQWLLPALAIPACIATVGVVVQGAAFGRAPKNALVATTALRELVRYRVMRGTESLDGGRVPATCVQGWFRVAGRARIRRAALVLLGNGTRLYELGGEIRVLEPNGETRAADLRQRAEFVLAGCPRFIGARMATDLVHGKPVRARATAADGERATSIAVGRLGAQLTLDVTPVENKPLELAYRDGGVDGSSDLIPGGGAAAIRRVRRAFELAVTPVQPDA